jgi:hypothetical protein
VAAITAEPPCPLEAAATVFPCPRPDRSQADALTARQHVAGVPGREAGDGVSIWRRVVAQFVFPPGATEIEDLVTHGHRALASLRPPKSLAGHAGDSNLAPPGCGPVRLRAAGRWVDPLAGAVGPLRGGWKRALEGGAGASSGA